MERHKIIKLWLGQDGEVHLIADAEAGMNLQEKRKQLQVINSAFFIAAWDAGQAQIQHSGPDDQGRQVAVCAQGRGAEGLQGGQVPDGEVRRLADTERLLPFEKIHQDQRK